MYLKIFYSYKYDRARMNCFFYSEYPKNDNIVPYISLLMRHVFQRIPHKHHVLNLREKKFKGTKGISKINAPVCVYSLSVLNGGHCVAFNFFKGKL